MKWKRLTLITILVVVMVLFAVPPALGAQDAISNGLDPCYTEITPIGTRGTLDCWQISSSCGQEILEVRASRMLISGRWEIWRTTSDGNFGGSTGNAWSVCGIGTDTVAICENVDGRVPDVFRALYECECPKKASKPEVEEEEVWERDHEMECFKVWVNEDNNFEFVFWWVYKDNNHVHIYDMDGILVREIDFEKEKPHFILK